MASQIFDIGMRKKTIELTLGNLIILSFLVLLIIQAVGLIFQDYISIKLGPVWILISVGISSLMGIAIFKKLFRDEPITRKDIIAIFTVAIISLLMLFFLRDFVPEIFTQGIIQLQSLVGF